MEIKRRVKCENEFSSTLKQICLYLCLATSKYTKFGAFVNAFAFKNEKSEEQTISRRTIFRYIEQIKPLFLDATIRVVPNGYEPVETKHGWSYRYVLPKYPEHAYKLGLENSYIVLVEKKHPRLIVDEEFRFTKPTYNFNLPTVDMFDKNDKKGLKLLRLATIFDLNIDYYMNKLFYSDLYRYVYEVENKDDKLPKPIAKDLIPKLNELGFNNLSIRTVERDLKTLKDACVILKKYKFDTDEWALT